MPDYLFGAKLTVSHGQLDKGGKAFVEFFFQTTCAVQPRSPGNQVCRVIDYLLVFFLKKKQSMLFHSIKDRVGILATFPLAPCQELTPKTVSAMFIKQS